METNNTDFCYIPQDSCIFYSPDTKTKSVLYADGASAGILILLTGCDSKQRPLAAMAHLTSEIRFRTFFRQVESRFCGETALYACGANPAFPVNTNGVWSYAAIMNTDILMNWAAPHINYPGKNLMQPEFSLSQCALSLGSGKTALGICVDMDSPDFFRVSYEQRTLTPQERDPNGLFTLAALFGIKTMQPTLMLHRADLPFDKEESDALVWEARRGRWDTVASLTDEQILTQFSAAPEYEPEWFAALLRQSAEYVAAYGETASGIGRRYIQF